MNDENDDKEEVKKEDKDEEKKDDRMDIATLFGKIKDKFNSYETRI